MMPHIMRYIPALLVATAIFFSASVAAADDGDLSVQVRTIVATVEDNGFDEDLQDIRGQLERGFEGYNSFRQIDTQTRRLADGAPARFELPTDDELRLNYHGRDDEFVRLGLAIGERLSTTLRATPGSTFFQAGLRHQNGILVLAITVQ